MFKFNWQKFTFVSDNNFNKKKKKHKPVMSWLQILPPVCLNLRKTSRTETRVEPLCLAYFSFCIVSSSVFQYNPEVRLYVGSKLECLWRSVLTVLMLWGNDVLVSLCQRGPSTPAAGANTNWATFGNLSKLMSSWARVMISSVSSSL